MEIAFWGFMAVVVMVTAWWCTYRYYADAPYRGMTEEQRRAARRAERSRKRQEKRAAERAARREAGRQQAG